MRARNIKPGFFKNPELAECPFEARILFAGLWCMADREGRLEDRPTKIKMELFPADSFDINPLLDLLAKKGLIHRYEAMGLMVIQVVAFSEHQNPHHKEPPSTLPEYGMSPATAQGKPEASPGQTPGKPESGRADSLIPDSLIPSLRERDVVQRVFDHWRETCKHPKATLDRKRKSRITEALRHFTPEDLCDCITGYSRSPFHNGQNAQGTRYDDIELFLRDVGKVEKGLEFFANPPKTAGNVAKFESHEERIKREFLEAK